MSFLVAFRLFGPAVSCMPPSMRHFKTSLVPRRTASATKERWLIRKEYTRVRDLKTVPKDSPVRALSNQMKLFEKSVRTSGVDPYFHRKSNRVVLAVLHVNVDGVSYYVGGVNTEASLPTGSICAERSAITKARTMFPSIKRDNMKGIAVLDANIRFDGSEDDVVSMNPLPPCGACREWLEKIQEESQEFYVLTFDDEISEVHERFLFWAEEEETKAPAVLARWVCRMCSTDNVPFSRECRSCGVNRFSLSYNRIPDQSRFFNVLLALWMTKKKMLPHEILSSLTEQRSSKGHEVDSLEALSKVLKRLLKNERTDAKTGSIYGSILSKDKSGRYSLTEFGQKILGELELKNKRMAAFRAGQLSSLRDGSSASQKSETHSSL
eukprot:TRINITY_DN13948_c0_g1_i1.p1 TRINITY_DN13948_c0_g1~~TRINITY_DN13948_c0_g1_i1.p1  ORF type:complete len:381 (-),score=42.17 TRINITY_DN13948_c0_g1_i1:94-1236(-)